MSVVCAALSPVLTEEELPQKVPAVRVGKEKVSIIKPVILNASAEQLYAVEQAHYAAYYFCVASVKEAGNDQADKHFASVFGVTRIPGNVAAAQAIYQKIIDALCNDQIVYVVIDEGKPPVAVPTYKAGILLVFISSQFSSLPFASAACSQVSILIHKLSQRVANTRDDDQEGNMNNACRIQKFAISTLPIDYGIDATCVLPGTNKAYATKGNFYYRYSDSYGTIIDPGYPLPLQKNWGTLPEAFALGFDTILVLHESNGKIFVTAGNQYIRYSDSMAAVVDPGYPLPIAGNWGNLPASFNEGFDCAFYLSPVKKTYVTKGKEYIRYSDPNASVVDDGYPSPIFPSFGSVFYTIDTEARFPNGLTYATSGDQYVRYSDPWASVVDPGYPTPIRGRWGSAPSVN